MWSPTSIPIVALLCVFTYLAVQAIANAMAASSKHRAEAELKIVLAQRGMSAAEIERVVAARSGSQLDDQSLRDDAALAGDPLPPHKHRRAHFEKTEPYERS